MSVKNKLVSIVIPVFNEADSIDALHQEVVAVCEREGCDYEIIIVDDGFTDDTEPVVKQLVPATYIRLRRNFGETAAMDCGIKRAKGD